MSDTLFPPEGHPGSMFVEVAWGANLSDTTGAGWTWTSITTDVRMKAGLTASVGRSDESASATPARLKFTLDNSLSRYSLGGHSPNWPNVRRNVPVRVWVQPSFTPRLVFQGYITEWQPAWDDDLGRVAVVQVEASGVLQRIAQGTDPLRSALYRFHTISAAVRPVDYWPLEEDKVAEVAVSATGGAVALPSYSESLTSIAERFDWAADTDNPATDQAPELSYGASLRFPCRAGLSAAQFVITWSMRYSSSTGAFVIVTTDDGDTMFGSFNSDGSIAWSHTYNYGVSFVAVSTGAAVDQRLWSDEWRTFRLEVNAGVWSLYINGVLYQSATSSQGNVGAPTSIEVANPGAASGTAKVAVAHLAVWNRSTAPSVALTHAAHAAHLGETVSARLVRLCAEQGIAFTASGTSTVPMGPQRPEPLLDLLRECEDADLGMLYDGVGPGLNYVARVNRENASVAYPLELADLAPPLEPVADDSRIVNRATASGRGGTKVTAEDTTGPMGTATIGVYDSSLEVNLASDADVASYANWQVHAGTLEGYRYPALTIDVRAMPSLLGMVVLRKPADRLTVEGIGGLVGMPPDMVDVLVEGIAWRFTPYDYRVTYKCSPYSSWRIATVASPTGDTSDTAWRLDGDSTTTLQFSRALGATTLAVSTASGPIWTTVADDYPLFLDVGGVKVQATACSGSTSVQSFTVDPLPVARAAGAVVKLWTPAVLGL